VLSPGIIGDGVEGEFDAYSQGGAILERAIRRVGMAREQFDFGRMRPVTIAFGDTALRIATGLAGPKLGVRHLAGFALPAPTGVVIPCFHPLYIRQGHGSHMGVLMRALRLAMELAKSGAQPLAPTPDAPPPGYITHPTLEQALEFEAACSGARYIAYDIETPYSTEEDSAEEAEGEQPIKSIQFSCRSGEGIYFPWRGAFCDSAHRILSNPVDKLGWNVWRFDNPILTASGCAIGGANHDLMWAWHHSQPDLPRGLQFAAAQQGWPWPWKHLDNAAPEFYGIVDVDVLQFMVTQ